MTIQINGRIINAFGYEIGVQGETGLETLYFEMPRYYNDVDLSLFLPVGALKLPDGTADAVYLDKTYDDETLTITWIVGSEATAQPGLLYFAIELAGNEYASVWRSQPCAFKVNGTLPFPSPQPFMLRTRTMSADIMPMMDGQDVSNEPPFVIANRKWLIPTQLQSIAVQNDNRAENITIDYPRYFDGYDLYNRAGETLLYCSNSGGIEVVPLIIEIQGTDPSILTAQWAVRRPVTSYAGRLSIQLKIGSVDDDNYLWQSEIGVLTVTPTIDGQPIVPVQPSYLDEFLAQMTAIKSETQEYRDETAQLVESVSSIQEQVDQVIAARDEAAASASAASQSSTQAEQSARSASSSAQNATASEYSAQTSATSASQSANTATENASAAQLAAETAIASKDATMTAKTEIDGIKVDIDASAAAVASDKSDVATYMVAAETAATAATQKASEASQSVATAET